MHWCVCFSLYSCVMLFKSRMYPITVSAQSCLTLCNPMDCSPPGSSVHGIAQARILEWIAISSSRGSSQPRHWNYEFKNCQIIYSTGILIYLLKNLQNSGILSDRGDPEVSWSEIRLACPSHSLLPVLDIRAVPLFQPHHNFPKEGCAYATHGP